MLVRGFETEKNIVQPKAYSRKKYCEGKKICLPVLQESPPYTGISVMKPVEIKSLEQMIDLMSEHSHYNVVSIRDSTGTDSVLCRGIFNAFGKNAKSIYAVIFDDSNIAFDGTKAPTTEDIRGILEWSMDKDDLLVHCTAGVSRSSAVAFLIESARTNPFEALKILNPRTHEPNELIIRIGAKLISSDVMVAYTKFLTEQRNYLLE
jgi:Predicted protein tyrosine phosphatase